MSATLRFDASCRRCPRLAEFLDEVKAEFPNYYCLPVPPFGVDRPKLLVVGLAPGKHGANATGRAFTGDHAGVLLYETLHAHGFASLPVSVAADDKLVLNQARIVNAVKCLPPQNKPVGAEVNECNSYLAAELQTLEKEAVVVALGGIAHRSIIKALGLRQASYVFGHAAEHELPGFRLIDSYHCSRYNTNTGRLTADMFDGIFRRCAELIHD